ncbi:MAG TPA: YqhV family protein [Ureibacillus sp.]|nr:YqhV family protein [Ureibacillus sp.]
MVYVASALLYMVLVRLVSGSLEITVAGLMYKTHDLEKALALNSMLALVGPCVLIVTTGLGVAGLGDKISFLRIICIFSGVLLILLSLKIK